MRARLSHPACVWLVLGLALALGLSTLGAGLVGDDLMQAEVLTRIVGGVSEGPWWDMFVLVEGPRAHNEALRAVGELPWWVDPDLRVAFFRPLTVLTHLLDHLLWPRAPWAMHLHSVAWYLLSCWLVWRVAQRLCSSASAAALAALIYASAYSHLVPVGWIAHRNAVVSTVFCALALLAHDRWRREGQQHFALLSSLALLAALLAGEGSVVCLAFLLAYALYFDAHSVGSRLLSLVPSVVLIVVWRVVYDSLGYGASGSGAYLDPVADPAVFLQALPLRLGTLAMLSVSPPFLPALPLLLWGLVALAMGGVALVFVIKQGGPAARFGLLAALLGCIPLVASFPFERLLVLTSVGVALMWGELLDAWLLGASSRRLARALALIVAGVHLLISPLCFAAHGSKLHEMRPSPEQFSAHAWPGDASVAGKTIVVLHTPNYLGLEYLPELLRAEQSTQPAAIWVLHAGALGPAIERRGTHGLELQTQLGWPAGPVTDFWRDPRHAGFEVGDRVSTRAFTVQIEQVAEGRAIWSSFRFRVPLDDPSIVWLLWQDGEHRVVEPSKWPSGSE